MGPESVISTEKCIIRKKKMYYTGTFKVILKKTGLSHMLIFKCKLLNSFRQHITTLKFNLNVKKFHLDLKLKNFLNFI